MNNKSVAHGVVILAVSSIILKVLSALYVPILKEIIGDNGYSIYLVGYEVFIFLLSITSFGIQPAITKMVAEDQSKFGGKNSNRILKVSTKYLGICGGVATAILFLLASFLAWCFKSPESKIVFMCLSPAIFFATILTGYRGYLQGKNLVHDITISNIIEQLINVIMSILFAFILIKFSVSLGSAGGTIGTTAGAIGAFIYIMASLKRNNKENSVRQVDNISNKVILSKIIRYSIPFVLAATLQNMLGIIDTYTIRTIIKGEINLSTATYGYYKTIINVPLTIITALGVGIFPKIIKAFIDKNHKELKMQTSYCYKLIYLIVIPAVFGLSLVAKEVFIFMFGRNFGYNILIYGSIALVFMAITSIQNIILQGINEFDFVVKSSLIAVIIKILINVVLLKLYNTSLIGAVAGTVISMVVVTIINHKKLEECFSVDISLFKQGKKFLFSSFIMTLILLIIKYAMSLCIDISSLSRIYIGIFTIILIFIGAIVYFTVTILLGGINKYELDTISPLIYKYIPKILKKNL